MDSGAPDGLVKQVMLLFNDTDIIWEYILVVAHYVVKIYNYACLLHDQYNIWSKQSDLEPKIIAIYYVVRRAQAVLRIGCMKV